MAPWKQIIHVNLEEIYRSLDETTICSIYFPVTIVFVWFMRNYLTNFTIQKVLKRYHEWWCKNNKHISLLPYKAVLNMSYQWCVIIQKYLIILIRFYYFHVSKFRFYRTKCIEFIRARFGYVFFYRSTFPINLFKKK